MEDNIVVQEHEFGMKWYLNGFPKSGMHALTNVLRPIAEPQIEEMLWNKPWVGTFSNNSWTNDWVPLEKLLYRISRLTDKHYLKSHTGYHVEVDKFLWYSGISHVFIYRDLRDVAVSQSYHVVDESDNFAHPDKDLYRNLGSHEEVLKAVITGVGIYPGIIERWEKYARWLDVPWVLKVRFEDLIADPKTQADRILRYGLARVAPIFNATLNVNGDVFDWMTDRMAYGLSQTGYSPTFRKGTVGQWKEEFTDEILELWNEYDPKGWVEHMKAGLPASDLLDEEE